MTGAVSGSRGVTKILFDTQALVMWITGRPLPRKLQGLLEKSLGITIYISVVSAWEFLLKRRFRETGLSSEHIWEARKEMSAHLLPLDPEHIDMFSRLPPVKDHHDPFDRMLIAQAICERLPLAGGDERFRDYEQLTVFWQ